MSPPDGAASWRIERGSDPTRDSAVTDGLVDYNKQHSAAVAARFLPDNFRARPIAAYAVDGDGQLAGGCVGRTEDVWQWLTVDLMWVREDHRRLGVGRALLEGVEAEARERGCRWAKLNTFDFQSPAFYRSCGYVEYGREEGYPPGHTNFLMRKDLG